MKRLFAMILCLCLLAGCGQAGTGDTCLGKEGSGDGASVKTETPGQNAGSGGDTFRVIQSENGGAPLLLAKADGGPGDVYTPSPVTVEPTLDGESTAAMDLVYTPGTLLEVTYGSALETYPARLAEVTAVNIRSDGFDDRCALYLQVLNDLWTVDEGLNSDVTVISVDLSGTNLSESEQAAVAWAFGGEHGISQVLSLNYEELAAEGYLTGTDPETDGFPYWENGCLFSITEQNGQDMINVEQDSKNTTGAERLPLPEQVQTGVAMPVENNGLDSIRSTVTFDAQKWRSALGAYFFADCTAEQALDGHWGDYAVGSEAIS